MAGQELGAWEPMSPGEAADELGGLDAPWWVAGGWAIDLLVGRQTRDHGDLDIVILRRDQDRVRRHLEGWDVWAADPPGTQRPWPVGEVLPEHVHDVWCRRHPDAAWTVQLMIDEAHGDEWRYRRHPDVRRPVRTLAGRASRPGLPVLSPDVQLLAKSRNPRPKDHADFQISRDLLSLTERDWLRAALQTTSPDHPWIPQL